MEDSLTMPVTPGKLSEGEFELELLRFELHPAHHVPTYQFRMVQHRTLEELGSISLRIGSTPHIKLYAGHIGYGVLPLTADTATPPVPFVFFSRSRANLT